MKTDLFDKNRQQSVENEAPLAARMRPRTLDEFIGPTDRTVDRWLQRTLSQVGEQLAGIRDSEALTSA